MGPRRLYEKRRRAGKIQHLVKRGRHEGPLYAIRQVREGKSMRFSVKILGLLLVAATAGASQPEWNPDGDNLYRLFRVDEPSNVERNPVDRIRGDFDDLIDQTRRSQLPTAEMGARLAAIETGRRFLGHEVEHELYDMFLTAVGNRRLRVNPAFRAPAVDPLFQNFVRT